MNLLTTKYEVFHRAKRWKRYNAWSMDFAISWYAFSQYFQCLSRNPRRQAKSYRCLIRCGWCTPMCPKNLPQRAQIAKAVGSMHPILCLRWVCDVSGKLPRDIATILRNVYKIILLHRSMYKNMISKTATTVWLSYGYSYGCSGGHAYCHPYGFSNDYSYSQSCG